MKSNHPHRRNEDRGFALVVTLSMMILLTIIAVGLLSLSSISMRKAGAESANNVARANARLALMLALGELQKAAGSDQRITADGSILAKGGIAVTQPNVVGVWKSWSPNFAANPTSTPVPNYSTQKESQFVTWLTSSSEVQPGEGLNQRDWAKSGTIDNSIDLFTVETDGFIQAGSKLNLNLLSKNDNGSSNSAKKAAKENSGSFAWTITQNATRAKINVSGPEENNRDLNDDLQVQSRPNLENSESFKQPTQDFSKRADRVLSIAQAKLDTDLYKSPTNTTKESGDYTTQGYGLITDVVKGGFKTDLNLAFEMSDSDFRSRDLGTFKSPFNNKNFTAMARYDDEQPLFKPAIPSASGSVHVDLNFSPADAKFEFPAAAVPTFTTLRSFYRTYRHMYRTTDGPTIFERGMDNPALTAPVAASYTGKTPLGNVGQTAYRPILDRIIYIISVGIGADREVRLVMTPVITLWNPYNVALEIEGAVAYPWLDFPYDTTWTFPDGNKDQGMANILGYKYLDQNHGRSNYPYFYASITADGTNTTTKGKSIRFQPGEIRVFCPSSTIEKDYVSNGTIRDRTINMRPVTSSSDYNLRGGIAVRMQNKDKNGKAHGFSRPMGNLDTVKVNFRPAGGGTTSYPLAVGLEDSTRALIPNPGDSDTGQSIGDIQTINFAGIAQSAANITSTTLSYDTLATKNLRVPFAMMETYHRTANNPVTGRKSDIVYTVNPRQAFVNQYLVPGTPGSTTNAAAAGPHYETRITAVSSNDGVLQTPNGRNAYYGATSGSSTTSATHLVFFEAPQAPLLSLASLQHADISSTCYSTAYQIGNSWASPYLTRLKVSANANPRSGGNNPATYNRVTQMPVYDYSYLANEVLWDSYFFSGAAPVSTPGNSGDYKAWNNQIASDKTSLEKTISDFVDGNRPLLNPRMKFYSAGRSKDELDDLKTQLKMPQGCMKIASSLMLDGAFNINSTSKKAWVSFLSGNRDLKFKVEGGSPPSGDKVAFPRFRNPAGNQDDLWKGYRTLSKSQIEDLADKIIDQIQNRGPFLSLGEFVNRRVENTTTYGIKGAIQSAIDATTINQATKFLPIDTQYFVTNDTNFNGVSNISPNSTGVGIPGSLTQADVLQSLAPVITARSDSFTIRAYGEAKDGNGKVSATAWCEAVVQRMPEFVDAANPPETLTADLNPTNVAFGRRFAIVSFRYLVGDEIPINSNNNS